MRLLLLALTLLLLGHPALAEGANYDGIRYKGIPLGLTVPQLKQEMQKRGWSCTDCPSEAYKLRPYIGDCKVYWLHTDFSGSTLAGSVSFIPFATFVPSGGDYHLNSIYGRINVEDAETVMASACKQYGKPEVQEATGKTIWRVGQRDRSVMVIQPDTMTKSQVSFGLDRLTNTAVNNARTKANMSFEERVKTAPGL